MGRGRAARGGKVGRSREAGGHRGRRWHGRCRQLVSCPGVISHGWVLFFYSLRAHICYICSYTCSGWTEGEAVYSFIPQTRATHSGLCPCKAREKLNVPAAPPPRGAMAAEGSRSFQSWRVRLRLHKLINLMRQLLLICYVFCMLSPSK